MANTAVHQKGVHLGFDDRRHVINTWDDLHKEGYDPRRRMHMFGDCLVHGTSLILDHLTGIDLRIVDIGCGAGDATAFAIEELRRKGLSIKQVSGADISLQALQEFRGTLSRIPGLEVTTDSRDFETNGSDILRAGNLVYVNFLTGYLTHPASESLLRRIGDTSKPAVINHHYGPTSPVDMFRSLGDVLKGAQYVGGMANFGAAMKFLGEQARDVNPMNLVQMRECAQDIFGDRVLMSSPHSNVLSLSVKPG